MNISILDNPIPCGVYVRKQAANGGWNLQNDRAKTPIKGRCSEGWRASAADWPRGCHHIAGPILEVDRQYCGAGDENLNVSRQIELFGDFAEVPCLYIV